MVMFREEMVCKVVDGLNVSQKRLLNIVELLSDFKRIYCTVELQSVLCLT
jgi:hypothetical protein